MFPASSDVIDQMKEEGVVTSGANPGASSIAPVLRMAIPWALPFSKSSKDVWSQVLVPCAKAHAESRRAANSLGIKSIVKRWILGVLNSNRPSRRALDARRSG